MITKEQIEEIKTAFGKHFVCEGYMKNNDFTMFVNEQPDGGFKWEFLDFKPSDKDNYRKVIILRAD